MKVTARVKNLYSEMYAEGGMRDWRDTGAVDKAADIVRLWNAEQLPEKPSVVEIGSGEGAVAAALSSLDFYGSYHGYELSESGVTESRARHVPGATFTLIDGDRMPLDDQSVDLAVLSHVVEHLEHPRQLIYEAKRIARHVAIEVPLELNWHTPRDYAWDALGHINKYTATSIRHLVQTCGLEVVQQFTMTPSRAIYTFHSDSWRNRLKWRTKDVLLRIAPAVGRSVFVYHEALLARSS